MRKTKKQTNQSFPEFLKKFEPRVLQGAVSQLNDSLAWELMKAFLKQRQREFEIASLDLSGHTGRYQEAAKASGYAQACEDVADQFIQDLVNVVNGIDGYVEGPARTEDQ